MKSTMTRTLARVVGLLLPGLLLCGLTGLPVAHAQILFPPSSYSGDTTDLPSFARPYCDEATPPTCEASQESTNWEEGLIIVGGGNNNEFTITSSQTFDGLLYLYEGGLGVKGFIFDAPLDNILAHNDDDTDNRTSKIEVVLPLSRGSHATLYTLVTTGFTEGEFGSYTNTLSYFNDDATYLASDGTDLWTYQGETDLFDDTFWNGPDCPQAFDQPWLPNLGGSEECTLTSFLTRYTVQEVVPSCDGPHFFMQNQGFNGILLLYEGAFDPNTPLANLIYYNDDWPGAAEGFANSTSAFMDWFEAGSRWFLVTTTFSEGDIGEFGMDVFGPQGCSLAVSEVTLPTATEDAGESPQRFALSPVYPNPFNPQARFTLSLTQAQHVTLDVFDVLGRRVTTLHDGLLAPHTTHAFTFEAAGLPSGLYTIRARGEAFVEARTAFLAK